jgi:hypothetical protein
MVCQMMKRQDPIPFATQSAIRWPAVNDSVCLSSHVFADIVLSFNGIN